VADIQITTREAGEVVILDTAGSIDAFMVTRIREEINRLLEQGRIRIVLNCCRISRINSTALGILVGRLRRARHLGGDIKIVGLMPDMRGIFDITGASRVFRLFADEESALADFARPRDPLDGE